MPKGQTLHAREDANAREGVRIRGKVGGGLATSVDISKGQTLHARARNTIGNTIRTLWKMEMLPMWEVLPIPMPSFQWRTG